MATIAEHYEQLFATLEAQLGPLESETSTGIVGFSAGGPVSIRRLTVEGAYVSCELSLYPEQVASAERENFELLTRIPLKDSQAQALLTAIGNLSMEAQLGHNHTIDVSGVSGIGDLSVVRLTHHSGVTIDGKRFGIYEVRDAKRSGEA